MISKASAAIIICIGLFFFPHGKISAQLLWRIKTETGFYKYKTFGGSSVTDFAGNIDGQLKYDYAAENSNTTVKLNLRPEIFGLENSYSKLKFKAAGNYSLYRDIADYNFNISYQLNNYNIDQLNTSQKIVLFKADAVWYLLENYPMESSLGYAYQNVDNNSFQEIDIIFLDLKFYQLLSSYLKISFGAYLEKFSIEAEMQNFWASNNKNDGLRFGPQFTFNYLQEWIINFSYKFIVHESDYTRQPSNDHLVQLLAGRLIGKRVSIILLVDYFSRKYAIEENVSPNILYTPFELENRILIKTAYKVYNKNEIYLKAGYLSNNIYYENTKLDGWNIMLGFEIRN